MNVIIEDEDLELLLLGEKKGKYKKLAKDTKFKDRLDDVYNFLVRAIDINQVKLNSRLHYEKLLGDRSGQSSVRIMNGRVERLIFTEHDGGITIKLIELNQMHYGDKL
jgi:plasmid maintenance system killer protein